MVGVSSVSESANESCEKRRKEKKKFIILKNGVIRDRFRNLSNTEVKVKGKGKVLPVL
jgi:hypothetical protein